MWSSHSLVAGRARQHPGMEVLNQRDAENEAWVVERIGRVDGRSAGSGKLAPVPPSVDGPAAPNVTAFVPQSGSRALST